MFQSKAVVRLLAFLFLIFACGCMEREEENPLKAADAMPPSYALGASFTCEPTFAPPAENASVYANRWIAPYKGVGVVIYEYESEVYAKNALKESLDELKVDKIKYKGKDIFYNDSSSIYFFSHRNLLFIIQGTGYEEVNEEIFLLIDWILYKLKIISEEPKIPEEEPPPADWLQLTIHVPKEIYKVGEKFEGAYVEIINSNTSMWGLRVLMFKLGNETVSYTYAVDRPGGLYPYRRYVDPPAVLDMYSVDSGFYRPGNFTIVYAYYDCTDIKKVLDRDCLEEENIKISLEDLEKIFPIKVVEKTIQVVEE